MSKESSSLALDLESLNAEYKNLLIEYSQAYSNYADYLEKNNSSSLTSIKDAAYWGTSGLSQFTSKNLQECSALCANTRNCTGATYNRSPNGSQRCWLRTGKGAIVAGTSGDYAIVPKGEQLLKIVENINDKLTKVNEKIQTYDTPFNKEYGTQFSERAKNNTDLMNQYKTLVRERNKIKMMIDEYQGLDERQNDRSIHIYQNYYSLLFMFFIFIVCLLILYNFSYVTSSSGNTLISQIVGNIGSTIYYICFGIIFIVLLAYAYNSYNYV